MRFFLDHDDDCHWYLIPADRRGEWDRWKDIPSDDERSWEPPSFAKPIDSPTLITFERPE